MFFTKIELQNFGIYKGYHVMNLQNQLENRNITLVGGMNGRGKTTIHDAVLLTLYDKLAVKYIQENGSSHERLLIEHINNQAVSEDTFVCVSMTLDDGTDLYVHRSWKMIGKRLVKNLIVKKNGIEDKYLAENWMYYMEEILPFGIAKFFFFNNEKITQLANDTTFEQIKSSIKSAIGVTTIEKTITHLEEVIRRKKATIDKFVKSDLNQEYQEANEIIAQLDTQLAEYMMKVSELERTCELLDARLAAKEHEFWASGGELGKNRDAIKAEMAKISDEASAIKQEIQKLASDPATPLFMCRNLISQTYNNECNALEQETRRRSDAIVSGFYDRLVAKIDAAALSRKVRESIKEIILEELKDHLTVEENLSHTPLSDISMMLFERLVAGGFQTIDQSVTQLLALAEAQESELVSLDAHLGNTDDKTLAMQLFQALKDLQKEKTLADEALVRQLSAITNLKLQREGLIAKRTAMVKAIVEREDSNDDDARIVKYAAMSIQVQQEFKLRLQKKKVATLSDTATECFRCLVEKESLVNRIAINQETLDITLLGVDGTELLKHQLSAGEQQMFAVSIVWALALTSGYKAPVMVDTPMARLDSGHRTNFVSKYLPAASSQVIVLSTDEEVYGRYLELIRGNIVDYYTLLYHDQARCTSIVPGYFGEVEA